jgi:hypothetical protein
MQAVQVNILQLEEVTILLRRILITLSVGLGVEFATTEDAGSIS